MQDLSGAKMQSFKGTSMEIGRRNAIHLGAAAAASFAYACIGQNASAQNNRPITFVVPYAPGGAVDFSARIIGGHMASTLGQTITIENIGGGASNIGTVRVAKANPDGLTLLVHQAALAINKTFYPNLGVRADTDLSGVGLINFSPLILLASKALPANSLSELVSWINQSGVHVKIALGAGAGSIGHLTALMLASAAGVQFDYVPYRGASPSITDIVAGHVDMTFVPPEVALGQIRGGNAKGLVVTSSMRLLSAPEIPTVGESGYGGLVALNWQGLFVPAATPKPVVRRLGNALQFALADQAVRKRFEDAGSIVVPTEQQTPEGATAFFLKEISRWGEVIRANKIETAQ
jgi:tripartite-type tricarboxylate transporter receptor subunit TctC